jgi:predicted PurR-regulated permease PerM
MVLKNYNVYFFFALLVGATVLVYFVIKPFLVPFLIAAILAHLFNPVYRFFLRITRQKRGASSVLACLAIGLIIAVPIFSIASLVVAEIGRMLANISGGARDLGQIIDAINENMAKIPLARYINPEKLINQEVVLSAVKSFSQNTLVILHSTYAGVVNFIFVTFITFFSLFYLFIDGNRLLKYVMHLTPLRDKYENILVEKFNSIVRATIKGTTLMAIFQGALGGILFWATGVASPVLLGILMMFASVIPTVGSGLVWLPAGIIMILIGQPIQGIIIILVGSLVISTVDNFIRPKLVGRDTQMHPLLVLFSSLGGIALMGIPGFIAGPIAMSLFVALWDIYSLEFRDQLKEYNA